MKIQITAALKLVACTAAMSLTVSSLGWLYKSLKKRIPRQSINEVVFIGSDVNPCCPLNANIRQVEGCQNAHCKAKLLHKMIDHIDSAKHLICIAMYIFTVNQLSKALERAKKRGVIIRIIADECNKKDLNTEVNKLQWMGIPARFAGDGGNRMMHHKFCLIDVLNDEEIFNKNKHPSNGLLINGSLNWTKNGFGCNWENVYFTSNECMKSQYKQEFDSFWTELDHINNQN